MTTTRQLARIANVSESTIRNYSRDYAELLSPQARGDFGPRLFDEADVSTLVTVANLRREDVPRVEIIERLKRGDIVIDAAPSPQQAAPKPQDAPHAALAVVDVQSIIVGRIEAVERRLDSRDRDIYLSGMLRGAILTMAFAAFVVWVLWLAANQF